MEKIIDIEDLVPDSLNFNKGTEQGRELMERSLSELGAGRSVLLDKNNVIIAGNKTQEAAIKAGIRKVRVVETTGDELVAVKRTDVDIDTKKGRELAFVDNLSTQVSLAWDTEQLEAVQADVEGFDVEDFGFDIAELPYIVMPEKENLNMNEFFSEKEVVGNNKNTKHILIVVPMDYSEQEIDNMKEILKNALIEFKGIKIK